MVEMRYFELTPAEQRRRLDQRQAEAPHTTWPMSDEELAQWAANIDIPTPGELDGSEPIDDSPAGFARAMRTPARVTEDRLALGRRLAIMWHDAGALNPIQFRPAAAAAQTIRHGPHRGARIQP
jgi:hypothetical protein